jgi:hypothetical protein
MEANESSSQTDGATPAGTVVVVGARVVVVVVVGARVVVVVVVGARVVVVVVVGASVVGASVVVVVGVTDPVNALEIEPDALDAVIVKL